MTKFVTQESLNWAVLFKLFELAQSGNGRSTSENLTKQFKIQIGDRRVSLAFEYLAGKDLADRWPNGMYTISGKGYEQVEEFLLDTSSDLSQYLTDGDDWLADQTIGNIQIPASDRIVTRSDNQAQIAEVSKSLEEIGNFLEHDNEVGAELGDNRDLLLHEISASKELISGDRFYLKKLFSLIVPALKFLSEKFGSATIGEAAKHLFNLILALF